MMRFTVILGLVCIAGVFGQSCDKTKEECPDAKEAEVKFNQDTDWSKAKSIYEFHAKDIRGNDVSLDKYRGHVAIIVNVASQCGLTDTNYKQLQSLFEKYGESKGLRILAFPSNEFAGQEPGTSEEILNFVKKYNVSFDMFEKIQVNGDEAHPLYKWLKSQEEGAGTITDGIKWNFTKFLIDKNGKVVSRFAPTTEPFSMEDTITKYL
ncbi:hypothetical protein TSAR_008911 [Trichomalopsis sarcophagae]|uniref:Glutathione peroxidase n=1 Tax=Trichomalopsis sarcophagae TaxID=543379 RepID=A0A232F3I3_9HYME|nr:hypothetical protein TSAR_008911 [Trichomalopsis sarcophagae]